MAGKKSFEDSMARLEEIARLLEGGEVSLDQSLELFDEGIRLARFCQEALDRAQEKVEIMLKEEGGPVLAAFGAGGRDDG